MKNNPLRMQLLAAAEAFSEAKQDLTSILETMAEDVARAKNEPLPIFPVIHHSPASAIHMVRWLRDNKPKLIFIELCEDFLPVIDGLRDCTLPVALQAFANKIDRFPIEWTPLSVVAPITEFSAEYQAIAYALEQKDVEIVFVDRAVDHIFQWQDPTNNPNLPAEDEDEDPIDPEDRLHGGAIGVELGSIAPNFTTFHDFLLRNAKVSNFQEWSTLYIEEPTIDADTNTYREVLFLIGSLFRRIGSTKHKREVLRKRDSFMWTRIKQTLKNKKIALQDCVFICGAAHVVNDCPEWGTESDALFEIPEKTKTDWRYGFIPSSHTAIEYQFGHVRGSVTLAKTRWKKGCRTWNITPFALTRKKKRAKKVKKHDLPKTLALAQVLAQPPELALADVNELLSWCTGIVQSARKNRYLASTADAIAIYETAILLAKMRSRLRPTPSDFVDAAETCLEKARQPGPRSIRQLCAKMMGGDHIGQVGYNSLPPLVQDIYNRLAPLGVSSKLRRIKRVLMDFTADPQKRPLSRLLWCLNWLTPNTRVARPIMGEMKLGMNPKQESWDVALHGREQRIVIQLAYEGISVEQVLERRLSETAYGKDAKTVTTLAAVEASIILLDSSRLTQALGERAIALLHMEIGAEDAPEIFQSVRKLLHYYRTTPEGLPNWIKDIIATGYAHYATQLPVAFGDRGTSPEAIAAMLSFVFTLESLALAMGCSRSQLVVAIKLSQAETTDPEKYGLLWAAQWLTQLRDKESVRKAFSDILLHPLGQNAYPRYLSGFLLSLTFAPQLTNIGVELLGRAFSSLSDRTLLPWIPSLIQNLTPRRNDIMPMLLKEATFDLPKNLKALDIWVPQWKKSEEEEKFKQNEKHKETTPIITKKRSELALATRELLEKYPSSTNANANMLECDIVWTNSDELNDQIETTQRSELASATFSLLKKHPSSTNANANMLKYDIVWVDPVGKSVEKSMERKWTLLAENTNKLLKTQNSTLHFLANHIL